MEDIEWCAIVYSSIVFSRLWTLWSLQTQTVSIHLVFCFVWLLHTLWHKIKTLRRWENVVVKLFGGFSFFLLNQISSSLCLPANLPAVSSKLSLDFKQQFGKNMLKIGYLDYCQYVIKNIYKESFNLEHFQQIDLSLNDKNRNWLLGPDETNWISLLWEIEKEIRQTYWR